MSSLLLSCFGISSNSFSNECSNADNDSACIQDDSNQLRRSARERRAPDRFGEWAYVCKNYSDPSTLQEALNSVDYKLWQEAMLNELKSINDCNVWDLVEPPKDKKIVNCKWIFKRKTGADGNISTYKARLVAQGYSQEFGVDYDETFSPVIRFESIRSILSLAVEHNLQVHHMDVSSAFLNGDLDETIYMSQPPGFAKVGSENLVCKLKKSIYGLKQAPKCWNTSLDNYLKELNFEQCSSDPCLYTCIKDDNMCILAVYVDDIILASDSIERINEVKASLHNRYKMKDLGLLNYFLGVNVEQDLQNGTISLNQANYIEKLLDQFNMKDANPVKTPVDPAIKLTVSNDDCENFRKDIYQSAVGKLLYLSTRTRPDITFAVCNVARYCSKPNQQHWNAVKRILRYLRGTFDFGIVYSKSKIKTCEGFSDADWAGDCNDRKSTSGFCFKLNGGLVSWRSNKQSCVALSTAEAEYIALAAASQEAIWLKQLLINLNHDDNAPMTINEDNQASICFAKNITNHSRTKHIDIKFHFIRDQVTNNNILLKYCPSEMMLADVFTKGLSVDKFIKLRNLIGVVKCAS